VVIPAKYQASILSELHLNHPVMVRLKSLARLQVWWSSLDHDVEQPRGLPEEIISDNSLWPKR